jgi:hypothetical protein
MSTSETIETPATAETSSFPLAVRQVPTQIRAALDRFLQSARAKVRAGLNLPSQAEIEALIARVEELDRKLSALSTPVPAPAPEPEAPKKKKNGGR